MTTVTWEVRVAARLENIYADPRFVVFEAHTREIRDAEGAARQIEGPMGVNIAGSTLTALWGIGVNPYSGPV